MAGRMPLSVKKEFGKGFMRGLMAGIMRGVTGFAWRRFLAPVGAAVLGVILTGPGADARALDPIPAEEARLRMNELQHQPWDGKVVERDIDWSFGCVKTQVELDIADPRDGSVRPLRFFIYRPDVRRKVPAVLVVPNLEGVTPLERSIGVQLCDANIAGVVAEVSDTAQPTEMPAWGHEDQTSRDSILALRTIIDYVERSPRFDKDRMAMIGLSLGGIVTSMIAALEPVRLKAQVVVVGGGNLPYTVSVSKAKKITELGRRRMAYLGITELERYEEYLHQSVRYDPLHFARYGKRENIMMVMAKKDEMVPYSVQKDLHAAFGGPYSLTFSGGHVGSLVSLTYLYLSRVVDFIQKRFENRFVPPLDVTIISD